MSARDDIAGALAAAMCVDESMADAVVALLRADPKVWLACAPADTRADIKTIVEVAGDSSIRERLLALLDETKETHL